MLLTLDSSIFVAALREQERFHRASDHLLAEVSRHRHTVIAPVSVLVEVVAAMRRRTGSEVVAREIEDELRHLSALHFVEVNDPRARSASAVARQLALRGMDALVVQIAREFGSPLVTLDNEMAERASSLVAVRAVTDF